MTTSQGDYLSKLEWEAIYILREVAGNFSKAALMFSGGKDSTVLVHLARKAFLPGSFPFPLLHIDTGHNFPEALEFRDRLALQYGATLIVRSVEETMTMRQLQEPAGRFPSRNVLQSYTLMDAIRELGLQACIGGGRRDEEKARAKERVFSVRDETGKWQAEMQRPELWHNYNAGLSANGHMRVFPISNWTEMDVWQYIKRERIVLPSIYFAHQRAVLEYNGQMVAVSPFIHMEAGDVVKTTSVRYRTVGDMTCTAAVASTAQTVDEVISELQSSALTERGETRIDDAMSEAAMEDRKRMGYF